MTEEYNPNTSLDYIKRIGPEPEVPEWGCGKTPSPDVQQHGWNRWIAWQHRYINNFPGSYDRSISDGLGGYTITYEPILKSQMTRRCRGCKSNPKWRSPRHWKFQGVVI